MPTGQYSRSLSIDGDIVSRRVTRTADAKKIYGPLELPSGQAGSLSTRTNNSNGVVTLSSGHGIANTEVVDLYWSGGLRYGMTASGVNSTVATLDGGAGDNLPAVNTAIVATEQIILNAEIDGDQISLIGLMAEYATSATTAHTHCDFQDSGNATIEAVDLTGNVPQIWDITGGDSNVFTGNPITHAHVSNGSATENSVLTILDLEDATP